MANLGRIAPRDSEGVSRSLRANAEGGAGQPAHGRRPPPGLAFGEPDDRLQRVIQYAAASRLMTGVCGILGRLVKPGDDGGAKPTASPSESKTRRCGRGRE